MRSPRGAVLITGASTGIGRATALHLDELGFRAFATVRREQDAAELSRSASEQLVPLLMDVTDRASIQRARDELARELDGAGLAGLVNNAGVATVSPLECMPEATLRWIFEVNLFGALAVTRACLPLLRQARGRIVNVSSTATTFVVPFHGPYAASKLALDGISEALRLELRPLGVEVASVIVGPVRTPIWEKGSQLEEQLRAQFAPELAEAYGPVYQQALEAFRKAARSGIAPERVAQTISCALTARRMKRRYFVGAGARLLALASAVLGGRLRDWIVLRGMGLSTRRG